MINKLKSILLVATAIYLTGCGGGLSQLAQNVLYPFESVNKKYKVPDVAPEDLKDLNFSVTATDGTAMNIHGWSYTNPNPNARVLVYLHGNGENLQALYEFNFVAAFKQLGVHFVMIDYPGLGRSTGTPNQANLVNSAMTTIDWADRAYPRSPVIVWGRSLGAAVAVQATNQMQNRIQGLVLTSGWNTFIDAARALSKLADSIPKEWLDQNTYDSVAAASNIRVTTLMHHGTIDTLVPFALGQKLFSAFPTGTAFFRELPEKGHNDIFSDPLLWQDVRGFIR